MSNQQKGLSRANTLENREKYYTKPQTVNICMDKIRKHGFIQPNDCIIEPSAGNGAFIHGIRELFPGNTHIFMDIAPEHPDIQEGDFFEYTPGNNRTTTLHAIGNPPFGRQSSTAIRFIKHACLFCSSVSFILPKSFKKESMQKAFPLTFHMIEQCDLPPYSFSVNGEDHDVPCVFQVWVKREIPRVCIETPIPVGFAFVGKSDTPDISLRRVGVYAGKIDTDTEKNEQSHYFIRFQNGKPVNENIGALQRITFIHNNTVGPKSISKPEVIREFNKYL